MATTGYCGYITPMAPIHSRISTESKTPNKTLDFAVLKSLIICTVSCCSQMSELLARTTVALPAWSTQQSRRLSTRAKLTHWWLEFGQSRLQLGAYLYRSTAPVHHNTAKRVYTSNETVNSVSMYYFCIFRLPCEQLMETAYATIVFKPIHTVTNVTCFTFSAAFSFAKRKGIFYLAIVSKHIQTEGQTVSSVTVYYFWVLCFWVFVILHKRHTKIYHEAIVTKRVLTGTKLNQCIHILLFTALSLRELCISFSNVTNVVSPQVPPQNTQVVSMVLFYWLVGRVSKANEVYKLILETFAHRLLKTHPES